MRIQARELRTLVSRAARAAGAAFVRRLAGRPRRAAWSLRHEVIVSAIAAGTHFVLAEASPAFGRRLFDRLPLRFSGIRIRRENIDGVPGEWVEGSSEGCSAPAVVLYLHGGGYITCSPRMVRVITTTIARSGLPVFAPEYRLGPEHPYPAALEDAAAVYTRLTSRGLRVIVAGDSAGGGLSLALAQKLRDDGGTPPLGIAAISPLTDMRCVSASIDENAAFDTLSPEGLRRSVELYAGTTPRTTPGLSPALGDFTGLPPLFIQCGGLEVLRDDALLAAEAAKAAGVDVRLDVWPEQVHEFQLLAIFDPEARRALHQLVDALHAWSTSRSGSRNP